MTYEDSPKSICSQESAPGLTPFDVLVGVMTDVYGQHPAHANLSARQAKAAGLMTSGTYGLVSIGSSASADLQHFTESRLRARLQNLGSTLFKLTWKPWVMPSGVSRSRLRASAPRISEIELIGWPTPQARDFKSASGTPEFHQERASHSRGKTLSEEAFVKLAGWPTTTVCDSNRSPAWDFAATPNRTLNHSAVLAGWRTPTCQSPNSLRGNGQCPAKRTAQGHTVNLTDEVNWLKENPHPARLTATGELLIGSIAGMENGGQLNPAHSRWLMGLSAVWDACAPTATASSLKRQKNSSELA